MVRLLLVDRVAMPISGLVLQLAQDSTLTDSVTQALRLDSRVSVGDLVNNRLPIVVETQSLAEDETVFEELSRTPGILFVELAFTDFSDVEDFGGAPPPRRRRRLATTQEVN